MSKAKSLVFAALALGGTACFAQGVTAYPAKPVRVLVGFTAGSELDVVARLVGKEMSEKWGQQIVVENRTGAGGTVAGAVAAKSPADGYTLFFNSVSHTASTALYPKLSYNPVVDFAGVSQATSAPNVLLVGPDTGVRSAKALIALARGKPGQVNFGSAGVGSGTHIAGEMFRLGAALQVNHVPYKGVPEVIADTVTGRIHYSYAPIGNVLPFVRDKRVTALAVTTIARSPSLPDVPTVAEAASLQGFDWDQWYGLFAPAKTPRPIVDQLSKEMARVLALPDIREKLAVRGSVAKASTPDDFDRFVRAETDKVNKVIRDGGIKLE